MLNMTDEGGAMAQTTTRLLVLGLLQQRPMHGYEITQVIAQGQLDRWANVLPGSIYHALGKLEADGLLRPEAEERTGDRLRKIYAITPDGREALLDLVRQALSRPPHDLRSDLALATSWIGLLPRPEVLGLLDQARERLEETRGQRAVGRAAKAHPPPVVQALFDNADDILDADLRLLERLRVLTAASASAG
jgi:DNA-binding PadR family transcriptional regulator